MSADPKFLIVDDFSTMRRIVRNLLKEIGFGNAEEAEDGVAALTLLRSTKFDFIVSDINMPNMDGLELLRALRGSPQWHDLPVVMITTEGGQARVEEAIELGATSYVRKPFSADLLRDKLAALLSK